MLVWGVEETGGGGGGVPSSYLLSRQGIKQLVSC